MPMSFPQSRGTAINWNRSSGILSATPSNLRRQAAASPSVSKTIPEGFVQTCVADTGCGIDPGHLGKLFQEFSKVPSALPAAQGTQLGLFITKSLVTMHRGTIWVESTPGAGTRFYFTVPVAPLSAKAVTATGPARNAELERSIFSYVSRSTIPSGLQPNT